MAGAADVHALVDYLGDLLQDNGTGDTPFFQPHARGAPWHASEKVELFQGAIATAVGERNWRRFWLALDEGGAIAGHVDLKALPDPYTDHRASLGLGVHRDHRRRGVGRALVQVAVDWAIAKSRIDWIDLWVFAANDGARALYQAAGFQELATFKDQFRIDGQSIDEVHMAKALSR
jgi:RimJ/RimL family protein N-acetyltransferase